MSSPTTSMAAGAETSPDGVTELSPEPIMQVGLGFWASKTLLSGVEMELFTLLADHPQDLETLRAQLGLHPRSARDFLDALVALGFLERTDGVYRNAPCADAFLDKRKPSYTGGLLEMANTRLYRFWGNLTEALHTGEPQSEIKDGGTPFFQELYADPERLKLFAAAMTGISHGVNREIAKRFPWTDVTTFADIGAAQGDTAVQIARAHPHLRGYGFDLPPLAPVFEDYVNQHQVGERLTFVPGDFFTDDLPTADVLIMGHIIHDWNLEQKQTLIAKAYDALPDGGSLIVYESMIDDDRSSNAFGLLMSLNMLIETPGGFDFTPAECMQWMRNAGFRSTRAQHLIGPDSMVVAVK
jgi:O-methyltransferase domain/Dimerisation domain